MAQADSKNTTPTAFLNAVARVHLSSRSDGRKILSPFDKRECINLKKAVDVVGKSESILRGWCDEHGFGRRIGGGAWSISKVALAMFLDDDQNALRAYHSGKRTDPTVVAYFQKAGLGDLVGAHRSV